MSVLLRYRHDTTLAQYVVEHEDMIENQFKNTILSDELFLQTLVYSNKRIKKRVYSKNDGNLRYIDWNLGRPFTWDSAHFNMLEEASQKGYIFARKFDYIKDKNVIDQVIERLLKKLGDF